MAVGAHPTATVLEPPNEERCYVFWNDLEEPEFWIETNDKITGGVPQGTPLTHYIGGGGGGSGLQRANDDDVRKDTRLSEDEWLLRCLGGEALPASPGPTGTAKIV